MTLTTSGTGAGTRPAATEGTILVVDDDTSLLRALSISLRARGYEVLVARTGEEGLDLAAHRHPQVVLLDLGLPAGDGFLVCDRLQKLVGSAATPAATPEPSDSPQR